MGRVAEQIKRSEQGSVLMEFLLVIPLYIAFFSGIFLLGDLFLSRSRLTAADRYGVWQKGNRHNQAAGDLKEEASRKFFPAGDFADGTKLSEFKLNQNKVTWYAVTRGAATLKMVLPLWVSGWRKGALRLFADIGNSPESGLWDDVSYRAREVESPYTHSVLTRLKYDVRDKSGRELAQGAPLWYVEYRMAYVDAKGQPSDIPPAQPGVVAVVNYDRLSSYVVWGQ